MDLTIRERPNDGRAKDYLAHITQAGTIVRLSTYSWNLKNVFEEGPSPDIEDMLSTLKNVLSRKDIVKYPWQGFK